MPSKPSSKTPSPDLLEQLKKDRALVAAELPDVTQRADRLREAAAENTLSGQLRKAIHGSRRRLDAIAGDAGISVKSLCDWLSGDRTLRSDVLDRVAQAVGADIAVTLRPAS